MRALAEHCTSLQSVAMLFDDMVDCNACTGPEEFRVVRRSITDVSIVALAQRCPRLAKIQIVHSMRVTDATLFALAEGCPHLVQVGFADTGVSDDGIVELARCCRHLKSASFSRTAIADEGIDALICHCSSTLTRVAINGTAVSDAAVLRLLRGCPNLRELGISNMTNITDATVLNVVKYGTHITLDRDFLRTNYEFSDEAIDFLVDSYFDTDGLRDEDEMYSSPDYQDTAGLID